MINNIKVDDVGDVKKIVAGCTWSKYISIVLLLMLATACSSFLSKSTEDILKPVSDNREYRYIELSNGLKVMIISDDNADKAAASLDVFVGSAQNPVERPGLAHFLEHMLFLGTEKYPESGEYQRFISENGGKHNAYTSFEHTNYFFEVNDGAFEPTLDRFAQFFIAPLFDETYLQREKHAVNAEYRAGIKNEERRQLDVLREVANQNHPFSRFAVGSLDSLSSDATPIRDDVVEFYQRYYRATNMTLSVLAPESLDELEKLVREKFSKVKSGQVDKAILSEPLFESEALPLLVSIQPEQNRRSLSLLFPLPDQQPFYKNQPMNVIAHVLGHEGKHSVYSYLKSKQWIEGLVAGQGFSYDGVTVFSLSIRLTEKGLKHRADILQVIFSQINNLKENGIPAWIFDELKQISELEFAYQDKISESSTVTGISNSLHYYAPEEVLHADYSYEHYSPEKIQELLGLLSPNNMIVVDVESNASVNKKSRNYLTPYSMSPLVDEAVAILTTQKPMTQIGLPEKNKFIPENLTVVLEEASGVTTSSQEGDKNPKLVLDKSGVKLWYKGVDRFQQPKLEVNHYFSHHGARDSAEKSILMGLYTSLLNDDVNEFLYDANMAGLYASVSPYQSGLNIRTYGFSDKQAYLVPLLVNQYQQVQFTEAQFQRIKSEMATHLANGKKQMPYQQLMRDWRADMQSDVYGIDELSKALKGVTLKQLLEYRDEFWKSINIQGLINGNISEASAKQITHSIVEILQPLQTKKVFIEKAAIANKVKRLDSNTNFWRQDEINHNDSAYLLYWQAENDSNNETALWLLLSNVIESGYYNQLRTQEQLGYIVFETYYPLWRVPGLMFIVQSPEVGVERIHLSTFSFFNSQMSRLGLMGEKQLNVYKHSLSASIQQRAKNLAGETQYYQRSLFYQDPSESLFKRREILAAAIENISPSDWLVFIKRLNDEGFKRMVLLSTNEGEALTDFKRLNKPLPSNSHYEFPEHKR